MAATGCKTEHPEEHPPTVHEPPTENVDVSGLELPPSEGYLLVDFRKCQGCLTCMLACSLAHEGKENLSLARLQVTQDPFGRFPGDLALEPCRQCLDPECLKACPTGALHVDKANGNVRIGDKDLARAIGEISRREMDEPEKLLHVRGLMAARLGQSRRIRRLP